MLYENAKVFEKIPSYEKVIAKILYIFFPSKPQHFHIASCSSSFFQVKFLFLDLESPRLQLHFLFFLETECSILLRSGTLILKGVFRNPTNYTLKYYHSLLLNINSYFPKKSGKCSPSPGFSISKKKNLIWKFFVLQTLFTMLLSSKT